MERFLSEIPADKKPGWTVTINGERTNANKVEIESRFGRLEYGQHPGGGYDTWTFTEAGHGGAITVPYALADDGTLLVGLIEEDRPNMGGKRWCAIGGFRNPFESAVAAEQRERHEEADVLARLEAQRLGVRINCNRAFFVADPKEDQGIQAARLEVPFRQLQATAVPGARAELRGPKSTVVFFAWTDAVLRTSGDGIALAGIAQLAAYLEEQKRPISGQGTDIRP